MVLLKESAFLLITNPEERGTDSPCPFLQEVTVFPGKMYTIVLTVGVFYLRFWDHLCWLCCVSVPIISHQPDNLGRCIFDRFCPGVCKIALCMHVPVCTPDDYSCKYLTSFSCTAYTYLLSILSLPSANSKELFPVYGCLLFYHGQQVACNHIYFLDSFGNETGVWKSMRNDFLSTKV